MPRYLLDTNILIAASKRVPQVEARLHILTADDIFLSTVVLAEIEYGIAKSVRRAHNRKVFDLLARSFAVLPFDAAATRHYGPLRATLEGRGQCIGPYDLMIAAQALAAGAVLVTDNVREFSRAKGLRIENWLRSATA